ncbi:CTP synthetase [Aliiroseovarius sp. KMU-50]|uniref:CTP synthetase n=1 Tax=Aliiroseovarius salicola TaxID=3009082 RepID=A0ABT4VXN8_9RHOB|nr:CTP synthetase [Aliiroseovarius sp. KMU-50]MDA5092485.1 CTP synthetase [Aliiroseovarius sp. KMU-50]
MFRLTAVIYLLLGGTFAGILIIAALVTGFDTGQPIVYSAIIGFILGLPASWVVARKISEL